MKDDTRIRWLAAFLCAALLLLHAEARMLPDGQAHWYFFDIGQGDSALLVTPTGKSVLFDGGPDLTALERIGERMSFFDRSIDLLVLSHPHMDHMASFPEILDRYRVSAILLPALEHGSGRYRRLLSQLEHGNTAVLFADAGHTFSLGDGVELDVLWPPDGWYQEARRKDPNDASVVVRVRYKEHTALITGDISIDVETEILRRGTDIRADLLKVPHHGSKYSSSTGFLLAVGAHDAVVSVGRTNTFGHPHPHAMDRLRRFVTGAIRRTDTDGTVEFVWK